MKSNLKNCFSLFALMLMLLGATTMSAQIINNVVLSPAPNPNLTGSGTTGWPYICAGANNNFNQYFAKATFDGASNAGNEWILELSDATGSFTSPVELAKLTDDDKVEDPGFEFSIPTTTRGNGYKMRVRSTNPVTVTETVNSYEMYYMDFVDNILINEDGSANPPAGGSICSPTAVTLEVANISNPETYQYAWYQDGSPLSEKTQTLVVNQSGWYQVFIDYGPNCTGSANTDSNLVEVTIGSTGSSTTINTPAKTALCASEEQILTVNTVLASPTYQWIKDGNNISGATGATYTVKAANNGFEGEYQVRVSSTGTCPEITTGVTFTNADSFTATRVNAENIVLLPGESKALSVTTTATSPTYKWYKGTTEITGETNATYNATASGTYYATITQGGGSCPGTIKNSEKTTVVSPSSFDITIDYGSAYTACENTTMDITVTSVNAVLTDNSKIDVTTDVASDITYQWQKDETTLSGETQNNVSLTDISANGTYKVIGTIGSFTANSNELPITLLTDETLNITSTSTIYCSSADAITITTTTNLTSEDFNWQKDGASVNTTDTSLTINEPGTYRLVLDRFGCDLISNEITIAPFNSDLIQLDPEGPVVLAEGTTQTVTATGGTSYIWYDAQNNEIGTSDSIAITEEGAYTLVAKIDNCDVAKQFTAEYLDTFKIPNIITPNGDGINDQWVLPNSYSNKEAINVIIYGESGEEVLNAVNYKNDWPSSTSSFTKQNMVFYYAIKEGNQITKQGTITVIR